MDLAKLMQEKLYEVYVDCYYSDSKLGKVKAGLAAMVSGAIDGAVVSFPILMAACCLTARKNRKK